jgi:aryl-alcohol dehydrogenase-like predicted oxidoreductase
LPDGSRATDDKGGKNMISRFMNDTILERVQKLSPIASDLGLTMAQLALAWVLANDNVACAIVGASRPEQVTANAEASGVTLTDDVKVAIDEALGDVVVTDPAMTAKNAPAKRPA